MTVTGQRLATDAYTNRDGEAAASLEVTTDQVSLDVRQPTGRG